MTIEEAEALESQYWDITKRLRAEFPCEWCDGRGEDDPQSNAYPDICSLCGGKGWSLNDEGDE